MAKRIADEEWNLIIADYKNGLTPKELENKYSHQSMSIINKLINLGLYSKQNYRFTDEDIAFLKIYYPRGNWDIIMQRFPSSTKSSIMTKMSKLGIKMEINHWSKEELDLLAQNIGILSDEELVKLFNGKYTIGAIKTKANKALGYTSKKWTQDEDDIMYKYYPILSPTEVAEMLPNRTYYGVIHRAKVLNIQSNINRNWSEEENNYIKENYKLQPDYIIAKELNRSQSCVKNQRHVLGLYRRDIDSFTYPTISKYIRGHIQSWKNESMKECGYKCIFTGNKEFQIHHLYGVSNIIEDIFNNNDIIYKENIENYSKDELAYILDLFLKEQAKYPLGKCVSKDIHVLFHSLYGQYYNTPEQWYQFEKDYKNGLYNNYYIENNKLIS